MKQAEGLYSVQWFMVYAGFQLRITRKNLQRWALQVQCCSESFADLTAIDSKQLTEDRREVLFAKV